MAHFAQLDENNIVIQVIVVNNDILLDENGKENERLGINFCVDLFGGKWIQTSYNAKFRKNYAGIGSLYDSEKDIFITSKPFASWILDSDDNWKAPKPKPAGDYKWDETQQNWVLNGE